MNEISYPAVRSSENEKDCLEAIEKLKSAVTRLSAQAVIGPLDRIFEFDERIVGLYVGVNTMRNALDIQVHAETSPGRIHAYTLSAYEFEADHHHNNKKRPPEDAFSREQKFDLKSMARSVHEALMVASRDGARDEMLLFLQDQLQAHQKGGTPLTRTTMRALHRTIAGEAAYDEWEAEQRARRLDEAIPATDQAQRRVRI